MKKLISLILVLITLISLTACGAPEAEAEGPKVSFTLIIVDDQGNETTKTIETTRTIVGDALLDEGLIEGEEGDYGMLCLAGKPCSPRPSRNKRSCHIQFQLRLCGKTRLQRLG